MSFRVNDKVRINNNSEFNGCKGVIKVIFKAGMCKYGILLENKHLWDLVWANEDSLVKI